MRDMLILERGSGDRDGQLQAFLYQSNSWPVPVHGSEPADICCNLLQPLAVMGEDRLNGKFF